MKVHHGNAKSEDAKEKDFIQTRRSKLDEMKETEGLPRNVYENLRIVATKTTPDVSEFRTVAPRNVKQIANAQQVQFVSFFNN